MIGCDIRSMSDVTKETLTNADVIAINQDLECRGPYCVRQWNNPECVGSYQAAGDGSLAIGMFNFSDVKSEMSLQFWDLGLPVAAGVGLKCITAAPIRQRAVSSSVTLG